MDEGVRKSEDLHAYIDVKDPLWRGRSEIDGTKLISSIQSTNKVEGDGTITMSILPDNVPLRITTGLHRLRAYCSWIVDHWDDIKAVREPLDEDSVKDCTFAKGLGKSAGQILAQDRACWIVMIEYIHK